MRIVIGSLQQEGNSLSPIATTKADFDIAYGAAMYEKIHVMDMLEERGAEVIPTLYANALPAGAVVKSDYLELVSEMLSAIPDAMDGIWLYLHGSMCVEDIGSGETWLLHKIREKVGYSVPIALALDFHANNTDEIVKLANIICGYRTAPHRDMPETERKAMKLLFHCIDNKILPKPQLARANIIVKADTVQTDNPPLSDIIAYADEQEKLEGMLAVNVFGSQLWVDEPYAGPNAVVVHEWDTALAENCARKLMRMYYDARYSFVYPNESAEAVDAIRIAMDAPDKQVFLSDSGDNTTAGAAGDNAFMLNRLISCGAKETLLGGITDEAAVDACFAAGTGKRVSVTLGGSIDKRSETANVTGVVKHTGNILDWYGADGGRAAVLDIGDVTIIITEKRNAFVRPEMFTSVGVDVSAFKAVVVKLGYLFPDLAAVAPRSIIVFTPGASPQRLEEMGHTRIRRPMYPLDDNFMD